MEERHYDNQNFFQLASIQSVAPGLLAITMGQQLSSRYGVGTILCSIALGNLLLWLVAIAVISMVDQKRSNAIENIKSYFGRQGRVVVALIFVFAMLSWYAFEINFSMSQFNHLLPLDEGLRKTLTIRLGAALGLLSAILSIGGIPLFRKIAVVLLPLFVCYHFYEIVVSPQAVVFAGTWGLSLPVIAFSMLFLLPGVLNFPTFFRHSRSKPHSIAALTLFTVLLTFFEVSSIWWSAQFRFPEVETAVRVGINTLNSVCCNLFNIYLAAACLETLASRFGEPRGFAILGLCGTLVYTFIQISPPVQFLHDLTNAYIAILGVVLLLAYLTRLIVQHRPKRLEKSVNFAAWLFGCLVATVYEAQHFLQGMEALAAGITASVLFFVSVIFVEETVWATRVKWFKHESRRT